MLTRRKKNIEKKKNRRTTKRSLALALVKYMLVQKKHPHLNVTFIMDSVQGFNYLKSVFYLKIFDQFRRLETKKKCAL